MTAKRTKQNTCKKLSSKEWADLYERIKDLDLAAMVKQITKKNRPKLINEKPVGQEVW